MEIRIGRKWKAEAAVEVTAKHLDQMGAGGGGKDNVELSLEGGSTLHQVPVC